MSYLALVIRQHDDIKDIWQYCSPRSPPIIRHATDKTVSPTKTLQTCCTFLDLFPVFFSCTIFENICTLGQWNSCGNKFIRLRRLQNKWNPAATNDTFPIASVSNKSYFWSWNPFANAAISFHSKSQSSQFRFLFSRNILFPISSDHCSVFSLFNNYN